MKNIEKLARKFAELIKADLTAEEMQAINEENAKRNDETCATQDYADANMYMLEAHEIVLGYEPNPNCDYEVDMWNEAWDIAKENKFWV